MSFIADKQTLEDLNINGKYKSDSIFNLFNKTHTSGGEKLLENMFNNLLSDVEEINKRSNIFKSFQQEALDFPFGRDQFDEMENYLGGRTKKFFIISLVSNYKKKVLKSITNDEHYEAMQTGLQTTITLLKRLSQFILEADQRAVTNTLRNHLSGIKEIFSDKRLRWLNKNKDFTQLKFLELSRYDYLLRRTLQKKMEALKESVYYLDVCITVGAIAKAKDFVYAKALSKELNVVKVEALYHPALKNAVGNPVSFDKENNVLFLTGANMAGKSTLMKTFGISMYLAHMGFPVAAKTFEFSIKDGIYSSINVPDDLSMGFSHFYAEVLRVKKVAEEVSSGNDMIVIFDELFKGTNVKDAYDATLAITEAFSAYRNCFFIISTHIIEAGEGLKKNKNIRFRYLPTTMADNVPRYTYKLEEGITADRQGMIIIRNESLLDIINTDVTNIGSHANPI